MDGLHVAGLERIFRFASRAGARYQPRAIMPGYEEIEVILAGHGTFFAADASPCEANPGDMLWFYAGDLVDVVADSTDPYVTIVFVFRVRHLPTARLPRYTQWRDISTCLEFCQRAFHLYHAHNTHDGLFAGYHYTHLAWEATADAHTRPSAAEPDAVLRARHYITQHYPQQITVDHIADAAGVSPSHLHLLFRTHLGISPMQQVIHTRVMRARELLVSSPLSVKEIGYRVGFQDNTHFCRTFKNWVHRTPSAYRARHAYPEEYREFRGQTT